MIKRRSCFALVLFALVSAPCSADIYSYVDEEGRGHFSDRQIDERYELFMKEPAAPATLPASVTLPEALSSQEEKARGALPPKASKRYAAMIKRVAREQKIDAALIHAVVTVESGYDARARSPQGATGLMQLMPDTAKRYGVTDLLNPLQNLRAGARYLRDLLGLFNNNLRLAIAAYNAGEGAVMKNGNSIPPYPETRAYVPRVMEFYERYRAALFRSS